MIGEIYARCSALIIWLGDSTMDSDNKLRIMDEVIDPPDEKTVLAKMLSLPYFRRRWVIQEVLRSSHQRQTVLCGNYQILLGDFIALVRSVLADWEIRSPLLSDVDIQRSQGRVHRGLLQTLLRYRNWQCSVPHDYLYALLGVCTDAEIEVPIDYNMSINDLYVLLAEKLVTSNPIGLLVAATMTSRPDSTLR